MNFSRIIILVFAFIVTINGQSQNINCKVNYDSILVNIDSTVKHINAEIVNLQSTLNASSSDNSRMILKKISKESSNKIILMLEYDSINDKKTKCSESIPSEPQIITESLSRKSLKSTTDSLGTSTKHHTEVASKADTKNKHSSNPQGTLSPKPESKTKIDSSKHEIGNQPKHLSGDTIIKAQIKVPDSSNNPIKRISLSKLDFTHPDTIEPLMRTHPSLNGTLAFHVKFESKDFEFLVVDLTKSDIKLHLYHHNDKNKDHNFSSIDGLMNSNEVNTEKAELITNAGMYMPDGRPQGLYIENKERKIPLDTTNPKNGDNFHLMPNGVFFIKNGRGYIETTDSFKKNELLDTNIVYATQSGPMLVINGERHSAFTSGSRNEKLRSGVGIIDNNKIVFAICNSINFYDFANFFKDYLKCSNALFLDGAVSQMYFKSLQRKEHGGNFGAMISVTAK